MVFSAFWRRIVDRFFSCARFLCCLLPVYFALRGVANAQFTAACFPIGVAAEASFESYLQESLRRVPSWVDASAEVIVAVERRIEAARPSPLECQSVPAPAGCPTGNEPDFDDALRLARTAANAALTSGNRLPDATTLIRGITASATLRDIPNGLRGAYAAHALALEVQDRLPRHLELLTKARYNRDCSVAVNDVLDDRLANADDPADLLSEFDDRFDVIKVLGVPEDPIGVELTGGNSRAAEFMEGFQIRLREVAQTLDPLVERPTHSASPNTHHGMVAGINQIYLDADALTVANDMQLPDQPADLWTRTWRTNDFGALAKDIEAHRTTILVLAGIAEEAAELLEGGLAQFDIERVQIVCGPFESLQSFVSQFEIDGGMAAWLKTKAPDGIEEAGQYTFAAGFCALRFGVAEAEAMRRMVFEPVPQGRLFRALDRAAVPSHLTLATRALDRDIRTTLDAYAAHALDLAFLVPR